MSTTFKVIAACIISAVFLLPGVLQAEEMRQMSANQKFNVVITLPAEGLTVGKNNLTLQVLDADNQAVSGATVGIKPWMPVMGHGVMVEPVIEAKDNGVFAASDVAFSMAGPWQLIVSVKTDSADDQATFDFPNISGEMAPGTKCGNCPHKTDKTDCQCGPDCKCEHCATGKGQCACKTKP